MTRTIMIPARPFRSQPKPTTEPATDVQKTETPQQISREEIRHRQRSMMNAMLCCMI